VHVDHAPDGSGDHQKVGDSVPELGHVDGDLPKKYGNLKNDNM
jgi:hypothetical protein